jgi:hypothetical protein
VGRGGAAAGRGGPGRGNPFADLPAFCRVAATLKPSSDSEIKMELWMPTAGWNGKFVVPGNGGFAGTIAPAVSRPAQWLRRRDHRYRPRRRRRFMLDHPNA